MSTQTDCRGRANEVGALLTPVLNSDRSATLLYGDSGIGKTTILSEVRNRLSSCPNVLLGFHEASQAEPDPLLRAVDDLLGRIYTAQGAFDQIRIACENVKDQFTLSALKRFLLSVMTTVAEEGGGLIPFAKTAVKAFGWMAERASALEAAVPTGLMPKLGIDALRDILRNSPDRSSR